MALLVGFGSSATTGCAVAQEVYVGTADKWPDLVSHPEQWSFVRANTDGLYVNFIMMKQQPDQRLLQTAQLMRNRNVYLESDMRTPTPGDIASGATPQDDRAAIDRLRASGFRITYTSLNYGWNADRAALLETYRHPGMEARANLVQIGPWTVGGDLARDLPGSRNATYRDWIRHAGGVSTDGPMGIWLDDRGHMRDASISMVRFAHSYHKRAMVMLCPYGAGNRQYSPSQFLAVAQDAVRRHEDADAAPDIWSVFEYATDIPAVPEQRDGRPTSTTTGVAYWLLHHLRDPDNSMSLAVRGVWKPAPKGSRILDIVLANSSPWIEFAPRLVVQGRGVAFAAQPGVTATGSTEMVFKGPLRLMPGQSRTLRIVARDGARRARIDLFPSTGGSGTPRGMTLPPG